VPTLVHKYGGSSVADETKIAQVADRVVAARKQGYDLVVVVSAMGRTTDELLAQAKRVHPDPPRRELDMLISVGERISMSLLSMAIQHRGVEAISFTGSQCGIITNDRHSDARIIEVRPFRIEDELNRGRVVIVAGFQGMSYRREITTLGRGGSDTTAVALAAALDAERCDIFGDVDGVYSADPQVVESAARIDELGYPEMQELAESGARVLNATAVEFAKERGIALFVKRSDGVGGQTTVRKHTPHSPGAVTGIAHEAEVRTISCHADHPGLDALLVFLDELGIPGKQLTVNRAGDEAACAVVVSKEFLDDPDSCRARLTERFADQVQLRADLGAVSLIGAGINQTFENMLRTRSLLHAAGIEPAGWHTSSFRITVLVHKDQLESAVLLLHKAFIEDENP
jgi:aspartate kinase